MRGRPPIGLGQAEFGVHWGYGHLREALPGHPSLVFTAPCSLWLLSHPQKLFSVFFLSLVSTTVLGTGRPQTWTPLLDLQLRLVVGPGHSPPHSSPPGSLSEQSTCRVSSSSKAVSRSMVGTSEISGQGPQPCDSHAGLPLQSQSLLLTSDCL